MIFLVFHQWNRSLQFYRWYYHIFTLIKLWRRTSKTIKRYIVLNWFRISSMVTNPGKLQIMFLESLTSNSNITFIVENKHIKSTNKVILLRITIGHKPTFTKRMNYFCNTASNRLRALTRIRKFLPQEQTNRLSEAYIMSTFKYCPLIWMFCGKTKNKSISKSTNALSN